MKKVAIPTTKKGRETRTRILDAAVSILNHTSYQGMTTAALAEEAGIAEGTLFRYFSTKKDIFVGMLEHTIESIDVIIIPTFEPGEPKADIIEKLSDRMADTLQRYSWLFRVSVGAITVVEDEDFRGQIKGILEDVESRTQTQLSNSVESGHLNIPVNSIAAFNSIAMGIAWYFLMDSLLKMDSTIDKEAVKNALRLLYSGV